MSLFFLFRVQMSSADTPQHLYWLGGGLGAITLASISAALQWFAESKMPTAKTVGRDLILGTILFFLLLQLLPESTMALLTGILSFAEMKNVIATAATTAASAAETGAVAIDDMELRVGVPNF
jgi:hypothetical protein